MKYRELWERFDSFRGKTGLKVFAQMHELDYNNLQSQYYDKRLPSATDLYNYSKAIGVSMEFLLTGSSDQFLSEEDRIAIELYAALKQRAPDLLLGLKNEYLKKKDTLNLKENSIA